MCSAGFMASANSSINGNRAMIRGVHELKVSKTSKLGNRKLTQKEFTQEEIEAYKHKLHADRKQEFQRNALKMAAVSVVFIGIVLFFVLY